MTPLRDELVRLQETLKEEGSLVRQILRGALASLSEGDIAKADQVIAFDDDVDRCYLQIEEGIRLLLTTERLDPADVRLVLAVLHINLHLERIADYCVTMAKLTKLVAGLHADRTLFEAFDEMGERAEEMIFVAMDSFYSRDLERAESLPDLDELIDRSNRRVVEHILSLGGDDPELREWGLRMILVSRGLERIGDHAVDIGEQAAFLVTGEFREFTDASHPLE